MIENEIIEYDKMKVSSKPTILNGSIFCSAVERATLFSYYEKIESLSKRIMDDVQSVAQLYFSAGEALRKYQMNCNFRKSKICDIAEALGLKTSTVSKSLRVYYYFKDNPEQLKDLSMNKALALMTEKKKVEKQEPLQVTYAGDAQREFDFGELFERPTESKIPLDNYRLFTTDSTLWLARKGLNQAINFATIYGAVPNDPASKVAYDEFLKSVQKDAEQYFKVVETVEKQREAT